MRASTTGAFHLSSAKYNGVEPFCRARGQGQMGMAKERALNVGLEGCAGIETAKQSEQLGPLRAMTVIV